MAQFTEALNKTIASEGGYVNDPSDPGGETYKGVARNMWSKWPGWTIIDIAKRQPNFPANLDTNAELQQEIAFFYQVNFWDKMNGDAIADQAIANSIFDFAVNAGIKTSVTLAQMAIDVIPDGILGPKTIEKLNDFNVDHFMAEFTVAKIARYVAIIRKRPASRKYLLGWITDALNFKQ